MIDNNRQQSERLTSSIFDPEIWRRTFLNWMMRASTIAGVFLLVYFYSRLSNLELIVFSGIYIGLLIATIAPLPIPIKANSLVATGYIASTYAIAQNGPNSSTVLYFLVTTLLTAILFNERIDLVIFGLSLFTIGMIAVFQLNNYLTFKVSTNNTVDAVDWIVYVANYVFLAIPLLWAINLLKTELNTVVSLLQSLFSRQANDQAELDRRVEQRTADLVQKNERLQAVSFIARETAEMQGLTSILNRVVRLITDQFGYYHSGIFIVNENGDTLLLQAASSIGGRQILEEGFSIQVGSEDIIGLSAAGKKPLIAKDPETSPESFMNSALPDSKSKIALPLIYKNDLIGVLEIQSEIPGSFGSDDVEIFQILADQLSITIENARLLNESQTAVQQIESLTTIRAQESWSEISNTDRLAYTYTPLGITPGINSSSGSGRNKIDVPIFLRGQKIGNISISRKEGQSWTDSEENLIIEVAQQAGLAMDTMRLVEESQKRASREVFLSQLSSKLGTSFQIESILKDTVEQLGQNLKGSKVSFQLIDPLEYTGSGKSTTGSVDGNYLE